MNSAEKLIEVRVKNEILVKWLKKKIKDRKENHYSFIDTDEVDNLLTIMGYVDEADEVEPESVKVTAFGEGKVYNLQTEDITDWAPTNPATDVMDEEF